MANKYSSRFRFHFLLVILLGSMLVLHSEALGQAGGQPSWDPPVNLSKSVPRSDYPKVVADRFGMVHVFWGGQSDGSNYSNAIYYTRWDGKTWSQPNDVVISPEGLSAMATQPAAMVQDDRLHLVWTGGLSGRIYYSTALITAAGRAPGWSEPVGLGVEADGGTQPDIVLGPQGTLYVTYIIERGANQGIYLVQSKDKGTSWSQPMLVPGSYQGANTLLSDVRVAVGSTGTLHAAWMWTRASEAFPPKGIRYVRSPDSGLTWSLPLALDGPFRYPDLAVTGKGNVYLVWSGSAEQRYKFYRWSFDDGQTWSSVSRIGLLGGYQGYARMALDSSGILHLALVASHPEIGDALYHSTWDGGRWTEPEPVLRNPAGLANNLQYADLAVGEGNLLHVVLMVPVDEQDGIWRFDISYLRGHTSAPPSAVAPLLAASAAAPTPPAPEPTTAQTATAVTQTRTASRASRYANPTNGTASTTGATVFLSVMPPLVLLAAALALGLSRRVRRM